MKTKKQLFKAAMKGPDPKYNTLLQLLDAITDIRNIYIHCVMEDEGKEDEAVRAEMKRVFEAEIRDEVCREDCMYKDREGFLMPACRFGGEPVIKDGTCKSYTQEKEEKDGND